MTPMQRYKRGLEDKMRQIMVEYLREHKDEFASKASIDE